MIIGKNKVISVHYRLQEGDSEGDLVEETFGSEPLVFLFGTGQLLPAFEDNLSGKGVGDEVSFGIPSEEAYGVREAERIVDLPIDTFVVDGQLAEDLLVIGNTIPMSDNHGNRLNGVVLEVNKDIVTIDFNHPMAGVDLYFTVKVDTIREATESELAHGHVHGPGGHDH
ncbi:MAG: hypothetical protein RLY31_3242 [Bacteroidota bacterium]|jgi:FKBP-type peptidyl-prolyl cis-trans isomerase SlyD